MSNVIDLDAERSKRDEHMKCGKCHDKIVHGQAYYLTRLPTGERLAVHAKCLQNSGPKRSG